MLYRVRDRDGKVVARATRQVAANDAVARRQCTMTPVVPSPEAQVVLDTLSAAGGPLTADQVAIACRDAAAAARATLRAEESPDPALRRLADLPSGIATIVALLEAMHRDGALDYDTLTETATLRTTVRERRQRR